MHYANGRRAKIGDKVIVFPSGGTPFVGILYDAVAGNDYCNGRVAPTSPNDPCPNLKEVLHVHDLTLLLGDHIDYDKHLAALAQVPDMSVPDATDAGNSPAPA